MCKISNDFVAIEYNDNYQKLIAKYCMQLFNSEPEFYKALLNGKTIINSDEISTVNVLDDSELTKKANKTIINIAIMKMNGVSDKLYPFNDCSNRVIYNDIIEFMRTEVESFQGIELAYDYYKMTKDFKYLGKYLYGDGINREDIVEMCVYKIENAYDDLLREKIQNDILVLKSEDFIINDFKGIMSILSRINDSIDKKSKKIVEKVSNKDIYEKMKLSEIPKISYKQCDWLVRGALTYIDPTGKLLDEYLDCLREDRIYEEDANDNCLSSYYFRHGDDYGIKLYRCNNLVDVITLVHEFAHLHYSKSKRRGNELFTEYPSIYYEKQAAEYLKKVGYSDSDIEYTTLFRDNANTLELLYIVPSMYSANKNMDKDKKDYDLSLIKKILDSTKMETIENIDKEEQEYYKQQALTTIKMNLLMPITNADRLLIYMVGTFFAEYAMDNLKHEDVLSILDSITTKNYNLHDVLKMHGIVPETMGLDDKPKQKVKNTNEQTSNDKE